MTRTNSDKLDELTALVTQFQESFNSRMDVATNRVDSLERRSSPEIGNSQNHTEIETPPPPPTRPVLKLDVPRFSGTDPHGWIFKISQFFAYHNTPAEERIIVASFYLDGPALAWYQWMYCNGQIISWTQFLQALDLRFAPT
ncbi:retrotransposon-derived protein PEG10-like, partial [Trifolium medium]|nr:retrotransposon-derived protein PEG10-like [Trifolium medium]